MTPYQATDPFDWAALLHLIRTEFSYMTGRIDPPSSIEKLTIDSLAEQAVRAEVWVIGAPLVACVILTPRPQALYIGKLAVAGAHRGKGLAHKLITLADQRACALGLPVLELQTRVELTENQAAFRAMRFVETGRTSHPGHDRATSITYRRAVATMGNAAPVLSPAKR